jgi:hypothetical protein
MNPEYAIIYLDNFTQAQFATKEELSDARSRARTDVRPYSHYRLIERRGGRKVWTLRETCYFDGV